MYTCRDKSAITRHYGFFSLFVAHSCHIIVVYAHRIGLKRSLFAIKHLKCLAENAGFCYAMCCLRVTSWIIRKVQLRTCVHWMNSSSCKVLENNLNWPSIYYALTSYKWTMPWLTAVQFLRQTTNEEGQPSYFALSSRFMNINKEE